MSTVRRRRLREKGAESANKRRCTSRKLYFECNNDYLQTVLCGLRSANVVPDTEGGPGATTRWSLYEIAYEKASWLADSEILYVLYYTCL